MRITWTVSLKNATYILLATHPLINTGENKILNLKIFFDELSLIVFH